MVSRLRYSVRVRMHSDCLEYQSCICRHCSSSWCWIRCNAIVKRCAVLVIIAVLGTACRRQAELPRYYSLPDFSLTDQAGKTVSLGDLKGKVWVADFIFTNCGGTCPMMTDRMHKLQDALPAQINLVSFTV